MNKKVDFNNMTVVNLEQSMFDSDNNTIKGVSIMSDKAVDSNDKIIRRFTLDAMKDGINVFQGAIARIDHDYAGGQDGRGVKTGFGVFENTRLDQGKIFGDLVLWDCDDAKKVASIAQRTPRSVGFSIHTAGILLESNSREDKGVEVICKLLPRDTDGNKASVDLVDDPASTISLFESRDKNVNLETKEMDLTNVTAEALKANRHDIYQSIFEAGAKGRDGEITKLTQERDDAVKKADEAEVKLAGINQSRLVERLLAESGLPEHAVTDTFKSQLLAVSQKKDGNDVEKQIKELIQDRKDLVGSSNDENNVVSSHSKNVSQKKGGIDNDEFVGAFGQSQSGVIGFIG